MKEVLSRRTIYSIDDIGFNDETNFSFNVNIPDDAFAFIACQAALEDSGVYAVDGNITAEKLPKISYKSLSGVKVKVSHKEVVVDISLTILFGKNIKDIVTSVQEKIRNTINNMTGFNVTRVNVSISDIRVNSNR